MTNPTALAIALAMILGILGSLTVWFQVRGLRILAARTHVPSDEYAYFRNRYRRRLLTGGLLILIGVLLAGAYLSGLESRADELGEARPQPLEGQEKPKMTEEQKQFFRIWAIYWIGVISLVFAILILALIDAVATRRYWLAQYRNIQEEHHTRLRRDLAVHRQMKEQSRAGRISGSSASDMPQVE